MPAGPGATEPLFEAILRKIPDLTARWADLQRRLDEALRKR
jgi:hypothetical protein